MAYERDPLEIGALWERTNPDGTTRLTGTINGEDVVCWTVKNGGEKSPKWRVKKSVPRENAVSKARPVITDQDVPF